MAHTLTAVPPGPGQNGTRVSPPETPTPAEQQTAHPRAPSDFSHPVEPPGTRGAQRQSSRRTWSHQLPPSCAGSQLGVSGSISVPSPEPRAVSRC